MARSLPVAAAFIAAFAVSTAALAASAPGPEHAVARAHFDQLKARHAKADVLWRAGQAGAHIVTGLNLKTAGTTAETAARAFVATHFNLLGVRNTHLRYLETSRSKHRIVARFVQTFGGRDVLDRIVAVRLEQDLTVLGFVSDAMPITAVAKAMVPAAAARQIAATWTGIRHLNVDGLTATASVLAHPAQSRPVWVVYVAAVPFRAHLRVLVDAVDGNVLAVRNMVRH